MPNRPPPPVLSQVEPDRAAVGDLLTLTGQAFAAGEAQVTVNFGSILSDDDLSGRTIYSYIDNMNFSQTCPSGWPYTCQHWTASAADDDQVTLLSLFESNNGWQSWMWPYQQCGPDSPCAPRQGWVPCLGWDLRKWCWQPGPAQAQNVAKAPALYFWLQDNPDYLAQTAIAASYGLMQVLYTTAIDPLNWNAGQPGSSRPPAALFDPATSFDLGSHYVAWIGTTKYPGFQQISFGSFSGWHYSFSIVVQAYNSAQPYTTSVCNDAWSFRPTLN